MVSLTFDEFHALRNRQRAVEEAASKSLPSKNSALSANTGVPKGLAQETESTHEVSQEKAFVEKIDDDVVAPTSATPAPSSTTHSVHRASRSETTGVNGDGDRERCTQEQAREEDPKPGKGAVRVGEFVERFEVQLAVVVLIFLDLVASTAQLLPGIQPAAQDPGEDRSAPFTRACARLFLRLMQSFTGFTVVFFGIEVAILLVTFRRMFFRHLGYILDLIVVSICLYFELAGLGKEVRLLGALRAWRVARVMNTLLLAAEEDHNATRAALRAHEKDFDAERKRLQESMRRELEARRRTERMLRGYKDEVETLNEALRIAAMDISEATASDSTQGQVSNTGKTLGQNREKASPAGSRGRTKRGSEGTPNGSGHKRGGGDSAAEAPGVKPSPPRSSGQIFVFQDGTFQAR